MTHPDWTHPVLAVDVLIFRDASAVEVLLVERGKGPLAYHWAPPGGRVEVGETVAEAACREAWEETGLRVHVPDDAAFTVVDLIDRDDGGALHYHYVLVAVVAWRTDAAEPVAGDDATGCRWVPIAQLDEVGPLVPDLARLVERARKWVNGVEKTSFVTLKD